MKIGICEKETKEGEKIKEYIRESFGLHEDFQIETYLPNEVLFDIEDGSFDCNIMIMDIHLENKKMNGIQLGSQISSYMPACQIIYLTNLLERTSDVYETEHCYFVQKDRKPVLKQAIQKAQHSYMESLEQGIIEIIANGHKLYLDQRNIIYISRENRFLNIVTKGKTYKCYQSLTSLEEKLNSQMVRCHGGHIVNLEYITNIQRNSVEMDSRWLIPVGRTYVKRVREAYFAFWSERL